MMKDVLYTTQRLIVRKWCAEDAPDLFAYCSDPVVTKFLTFPTYKSIDDAHERLRCMQEYYAAYERGEKSAKTQVDFAIVLKETNKAIGSVGWVGYSDLAGGIIELGALLHSAYHGKGIMTEALVGMFRYIKKEGLAKRIEAKHDVNNKAAGANLKRAGMSFEGIRRMGLTNNSTPRADAAVYSILAEEIDIDLEKAKEILHSNKELTCVLVKGDEVYTNVKSGVAPMMEFIDRKLDLNGFSAADRIVGKAVAMMFVNSGVASVYGSVMSKTAANFLEIYNVQHSYGKLVDTICNRSGNGICPMEKAVEGASEPRLAHNLLQNEIKKLKGEKENMKESCAHTASSKRLGFGCMRMPLLNEDEATSFDFDTINIMFDKFIANGFTLFDTAYPYHRGESENMIKRCLVDRYARDKFQLSNKLPTWRLESKEDPARFFNEQLGKCGVDYFDYYLLHTLNAEKYQICKRFDAFNFGYEMKKQGKIKKFGFSFHDTPELLDEILTANPNIDFVLLQINYIDWNNPGVQSRRCYEVARKHNKPIMVMEPIKGGNLATLPPEAEKLMKQVHPKMSVASWAVRYAASLEGVFMVLSGMNSPQHLDDNISFMSDFKPLSNEEKAVIEKVVKILNAQNTIPCTQCGYCVDGCPQRIAIPTYFSLYNSLCQDQNTTGGFSSQWAYYGNIIARHGKASDCIDCKQCESVCPQHLEISRLLREDVAAKLEKTNHAPNQTRKRK